MMVPACTARRLRSNRYGSTEHNGVMAPPPQQHGSERPRRRSTRELAEIFGDVLPDTTRDERDLEVADARSVDDWYLANRPPHHDR